MQLVEALDRLLRAAVPMPAESVPVMEAGGRIAAEDVAARQPVPQFARSAMDGYVCHEADVRDASADRPVRLRISGDVRMGEAPSLGPARGEVWSITTGAPIPRRGDRVLPVESVGRDGDHLRVDRPPGAKTHVSAPGETIRAGVPLIRAGEEITPEAAGALAASGVAMVRVHRRPRLALVATGDELVDIVEHAAPLPAGRVFNSNAVTLRGLLSAAGCAVDYHGIVRDVPDAMRATFAGLRERYDIVLSTGGVSIGSRDAVHRTWLDLGAERIVGRVDLKPGGPFFAGRMGAAWAVGLSGTPVAGLAAFHLLARPLLARLTGRRHAIRPIEEVILAADFPRPTGPARALWARVDPLRSSRRLAELLRDSTRGDLAALLGANALVLLPAGSPPVPAGSAVTALRLDLGEDRNRLSVDVPRLAPLTIGVIGPSGSGKTAVIVALVRRLTQDGMRAAAVKHAAHGFDLDRPGTDSARMADAGAAVVVLAGPTETVVRCAAPLPDAERAGALAVAVADEIWGGPPHVVFIEGFQHPSRPVITVGTPVTAPVSEVLASVPAVNGTHTEGLDERLRGVLEAVRLRAVAAPASGRRD